jgi:hypothetical protein
MTVLYGTVFNLGQLQKDLLYISTRSSCLMNIHEHKKTNMIRGRKKTNKPTILHLLLTDTFVTRY